MHTLPRNSAGHTLFLFFASFRRSKSALCHLLCKVTCSLRTDKRLGNNVTSVDEYWKIVTAQQLGDRICTSYTMFWGSCTFHVSNVIVELRKRIQVIIYTSFLCWKSNFKNPRFGFQQVCGLVVSNVSCVWKPDETLALVIEILHQPFPKIFQIPSLHPNFSMGSL